MKIQKLLRPIAVGVAMFTLATANIGVALAAYPCNPTSNCYSNQVGCDKEVIDRQTEWKTDCINCDDNIEHHMATWQEERIYWEEDCPDAPDTAPGSTDSAGTCYQAYDVHTYGCCRYCEEV